LDDASSRKILPEFIALRDKYDFFTRCQTPELAAEITVQPRRIPDADFIFGYIGNSTSHGIEVEMKPILVRIYQILFVPFRMEKVIVPDVHETLGYVLMLLN
jgi:uroporphyrinogen decarboxylase